MTLISQIFSGEGIVMSRERIKTSAFVLLALGLVAVAIMVVLGSLQILDHAEVSGNSVQSSGGGVSSDGVGEPASKKPGRSEHPSDGGRIDFWSVNPALRIVVPISEETACERIEEGLVRKTTAALLPAKRPQLTTIQGAYDWLRDNAVFMDFNAPLVGMDHGDSFVFTHWRTDQAEDAFLQSMVVMKVDGAIYGWVKKKSAIDSE